MYRVRDFAEERTRTLYVRLPHTIHDPKEVNELFNGDAKVKLPRQSSRACHVIFPSVEEKIKGLKQLKTKRVDGKRVVAYNPRTKPVENKTSRKKIFVPTPQSEHPLKITQTLLVSNIKKKTTGDELKKAFPGCVSVVLLKANSQGLRSAFVKMDSVSAAAEYVRKEKEWPIVEGSSLRVEIAAENPIKKEKKASKPASETAKLNIYDGDGEVDENNFETLNTKGKGKKKYVETSIEIETEFEGRSSDPEYLSESE